MKQPKPKAKLHGKYQAADIPDRFPTNDAKTAEGSLKHAKNALNQGELTWVQFNQIARRARAAIGKKSSKTQA